MIGTPHGPMVLLFISVGSGTYKYNPTHSVRIPCVNHPSLRLWRFSGIERQSAPVIRYIMMTVRMSVAVGDCRMRW